MHKHLSRCDNNTLALKRSAPAVTSMLWQHRIAKLASRQAQVPGQAQPPRCRPPCTRDAASSARCTEMPLVPMRWMRKSALPQNSLPLDKK